MHFSITELPTCAGADKEYFMDREVAVVGRGRDDVVLCGARGRGKRDTPLEREDHSH